MRFHPEFRNQRGSVPIALAFAASVLMLGLSNSQQVVALFRMRGNFQTAAIKAAHGANLSSLALAQQVVAGRLVYPQPDWQGHIGWVAPVPATSMWYFDSAPAGGPYAGKPRISVGGCNPQTFNNLHASDMFGTQMPPNVAACTSAARDLTTRISMTGMSNNGFYVPGGDNFITVAATSTVPIRNAALVPTLPISDNARIEMPPPVPYCSANIAPTEIVIGQTVTMSMSTSPNTQSGFLPNSWNSINWGAPVISSPPNYLGAPVPTASTVLSPQSIGTLAYTAGVVGFGPGTTNFCTSNTVRVYTPPTCSIVAPTTVVVGSTITVYFSTNHPTSPILAAAISGPNAPGPTAATGANFNYYAGTIGTFTYNGSVAGVNGSSASCTRTIQVVPQAPSCSMAASPGRIRFPAAVSLSISSNGYYGAIDSVFIEGQYVGVSSGSRDVVPPAPGDYNYSGRAHSSYQNRNGYCSVGVHVDPPPVCRFKDPNYYEMIYSPGVGANIPVGQTYNSTGVNNCPGGNVRAYPAPPYGTWDAVIHPRPENPGYNPLCNQAPHMCILSFALAACSDPAPNFFVDNIEDENCHINQYFIRMPGDGCFAPETRVRLADGSWKRADAIRAGDRLYRPGAEPLRVERVYAGPETEPMYLILAGEKRLLVSSGHPMVTRQGTKPAKAVRAGDELLMASGDYATVKEAGAQPVKPDQWVWNFQTSESSQRDTDHYLVAEGVVTGDLNLQRTLKERGARRRWALK